MFMEFILNVTFKIIERQQVKLRKLTRGLKRQDQRRMT